MLQNHLGPCKPSSLDPSPRESDSGGWGEAWELAFPPSCQMVAVLVVWGPHFENHCPSCPLRLPEKLVLPRRCSLLVRWLLSTSSCIESCRELAPIKCGKCTVNWQDGINVPWLLPAIEGLLRPVLCPRGLRGQRTPNEQVKVVWLQLPFGWDGYIMSFIIRWMNL